MRQSNQAIHSGTLTYINGNLYMDQVTPFLKFMLEFPPCADTLCYTIWFLFILFFVVVRILWDLGEFVVGGFFCPLCWVWTLKDTMFKVRYRVQLFPGTSFSKHIQYLMWLYIPYLLKFFTDQIIRLRDCLHGNTVNLTSSRVVTNRFFFKREFLHGVTFTFLFSPCKATSLTVLTSAVLPKLNIQILHPTLSLGKGNFSFHFSFKWKLS